jgi:hypothetical protein
MKFCQDCGTPHECSAEIAADRTELAIAKVQADRDIRLAEIGARAEVKVAEVEAEHSADHAEGIAEGMETALEAVTGGGDDETVDAAPIVVEASADPESEPAPESDIAPPLVVPEPKTPKRSGSGWWDGYR